MNLLTILFNFFIKIRSDKSILEVRQVHLFENNFWNRSCRLVEAGEDYLYAFNFIDERKEDLCSYFEAEDCFYLDLSTGSRYVELSEHLEEKIFSCLNLSDVDKNFIRIQFLTTNRPIKNYKELRNYKGKKVYHETHMWGEKSINNDGIINLKFDEDRSRIIYIKEKFKQLIGERLYQFNELKCECDCKNPLKDLEKNKDFELCAFSDYYECYYLLRSFLRNSNFFGLKKNDENEMHANETIMNPTKFMQRISKMIKKDLKKLSGDAEKNMLDKFYAKLDFFRNQSINVSNTKEALKTYKWLLKKCFNDLKLKMVEKKIFFHIGGKYNVDFYFKELYNLASEKVKEFQEKYEMAGSEGRDVVFQEICGSFYDSLLKLQKKIIAELFESDFIHEQFSKLLCKEVKTPEDIEVVELIIFDYLNMLTYLSGFSYITGSSRFSIYHYPLSFNRDHKCKIINCLKIKLETPIYNGFGKIEAFNKKGEEVEFKSNVHFFLKHLTNNEFYCTLEVLRKLNIKKIKITTLNEDFCEIVEVNKFISY